MPSKLVPHKLFDFLKKESGLVSDKELANALDTSAASISRIRKREYPIPAEMILNIHKQTEMPVAEIEAMINSEEI